MFVYNYQQTLLTNPCFNFKQGSKRNTCKKSNKQTLDAPTTGVKFRSHKRVYADLTPRITRSKGSITRPDCLTSSDIPPPSHPDVSGAVELLGNSTNTQTTVQG